MKHSSDQLWLDGFEPPWPPQRAWPEGPRPEGRRDLVFFAIRPDDAAQAQIADLTMGLTQSRKLVGRPMRSERLHLTLPWIRVPRANAAALVPIAGIIANGIECACFDLVLDRVLSFKGRPGSRPLVLTGQSEPLRRLYAELRVFGLGQGRRPEFTPHVTLLYDPANVLEHVVEPVRWTVRELLLIHSLRGQGRHVVLARWPLRD